MSRLKLTKDEIKEIVYALVSRDGDLHMRVLCGQDTELNQERLKHNLSAQKKFEALSDEVGIEF